MNVYPNRKFWEDDLEVPVNYLLERFHNTEVRHSWMNSLSGRQLSVIFQHCFKDKLNGQLFDDQDYDNTSIQYKRKVIAKHLDSLVIYYLISCFERAKLEATVSEIARSALTEELMKSYLLKGNNKYDKKSLLFLLFHVDHNLLKSVYHFEKIQRKGSVSFALQKTPRQPNVPFKDFISQETIVQILKEDDIKRNDGFENQLQGFFYHQNRLYVLVRRASGIDLLLNSNKVIHGHKPDWMILDFLVNGTQVDLTAKNIDQATEIANSIASRYFSSECVFVNAQDKNFAEQVYKFIKVCVDGSDSNIFTFELKFQSNRFKYSNTCITLTVIPHDPIASELYILHPSIGDILKSIELMKIIFQGKKIGLFFKRSDEHIAIYYSEYPLNKKEREDFKAYMKQFYGLTILPRANL
ncbi:hypothetical protein [Wolbachia endosymbiont of Nomada ferruginata]|uniref:hypothetical protein n=1 Tax=Wolbachia endosymbiont of Nomada ferruginata TaxID=1854761 RepID=UPI0007EED581|nr:hypothetical protein [Wolbachia endosymbiont of Nomada ferruginata]